MIGDMIDDYNRFFSSNGKREVLVVDDEVVNREILGNMLSREFNVLYAVNGKDALREIRDHKSTLSIILLDLKMPVMDGFEVMEALRDVDDEDHEEFEDIPVLVMTSDEGAEVTCLEAGAIDFINKPLNHPDVVLARIRKTIELKESIKTIKLTERADMTGLLTKNFFYTYAAQFDRHHPDTHTDAIAININNFHLINELYGRKAGDSVLMHMAAYLKEVRDKTGCIVSRVEGDLFFMYMPTGTVDYDMLSEEIDAHFDKFPDIAVRIRSGIYRDVDKSIEMERRFDRAVQAANTIKGDYGVSIGYYDAETHNRKLYEARLINDFDDALAAGEFQLYFQPKYNIDKEEPYLASAEALIRWKHPSLGMISPGIFIPLFEKNGLIKKLDFWIWREAIKYMSEWKEKYGKEITLSINISRVDLYSHNLVSYIDENLNRYGVSKDHLYLEITESAYTENTDQLMSVVKKLQEDGFRIEMDDFGTGYSSLAMLAQVPVDIIKLDMRFVEGMHESDKQEKMIRLIMDIARYLDIRVIAEGVEDKETVDFLKSVGCNTIQGFYFSKPLPEEEFVTKFTEE